jgi:hypothetical protein
MAIIVPSTGHNTIEKILLIDSPLRQARNRAAVGDLARASYHPRSIAKEGSQTFLYRRFNLSIKPVLRASKPRAGAFHPGFSLKTAYSGSLTIGLIEIIDWRA